jgi:hypothetical protein
MESVDKDYITYINKEAKKLQLEEMRTGVATVNALPQDVETLKAIWRTSEVAVKSVWDTESEVLSIDQTGDSSFKLLWKTKETFTDWSMRMITPMYHVGYMLEARNGQMHFEPRQNWKPISFY